MANEGYRPGALRHRVVIDEKGERLVLPYRRRPTSLAETLFVVAVVAVAALPMIRTLGTPIDLVSVEGISWLLMVVSLLASEAGQRLGRETIRVRGGYLEISRGIGPLRRTWRFPVTAIRGLTAWETPDNFVVDRWRTLKDRWPWARPRDGAVKLDCGRDSFYLAEAADPPEGLTIAQWLARRLPPSATEWEATDIN